MKTRLTETQFKSPVGTGDQLLSRAACLGAIILMCSTAWAQNLFVSGSGAGGGDWWGSGAVFEFTWDGKQSIFAFGLTSPRDLAFDSAGNLFVVEVEQVRCTPHGCLMTVIDKITPDGQRSTLASAFGYLPYLAVDKAGNVFVADYDRGVIYKYKADGSRTTFASGLHHPVGLAFDSVDHLFVADNSIGNIYQGTIYEYKPDGSRTIFAVLDPSDRPADLAFDSMGNLYMADLGGNIYKYWNSFPLRRYRRTTFGSVPNIAQSLTCDRAGNLFVVDAGDVNGNGNDIYKFTQQGVRSIFASGQALREEFSYLAFEPTLPVCCQ
jgi:sugar lactone lactonase YvrE